jgi:hypothetical protein
MTRIYHDADLRESLVKKSRIQREKFTWEKTADKLWLGIERCLEK